MFVSFHSIGHIHSCLSLLLSISCCLIVPFKISIYNCSLLVHRNTIIFYILTLHPVILLNSLLIVLFWTQDFLHIQVCHLQIETVLLLFNLYAFHFYFLPYYSV